MAEASMRMLLEKRRPGKIRVISAGTGAATGFPATMYANEAVKIWSCDLSKHKSRQLTRGLIEDSDLIFGMTSDHVKEVLRMTPSAIDRTYLLKNFPESGTKGEPVEDPVGQSLDRYNETFLEIGEYLGKHLEEIVKRIDEKIPA
jgi:protein-tyrosine-phosphatase